MTKQGAGAAGLAYWVVAGIVVIWAVLTVLDMPNTTYTGYSTTAQNVVNNVEAGSPAEAAGLMVGDQITSFDGIPVEDVRALNEAPRVVPGTVRQVGVDRDGQAMTLSVTVGSPAGVNQAVNWIGILIGLIYLLLPFWALSKTGSAASVVLAWFGVCFALAFLPGPYISSPMLRNLVGAVFLTAILLGFAMLLRFVLTFPSESPFLSKPAAKLWIFGPAVFIALMFAYLFIGQPAATAGLNTVVNILIGAFIIGYFGASLFVLIGRYRSASPEARASSGLSLVLWGAVIALVPLLLTSILNLVTPMTVLPGQQFYFLTLAVIPIAFSLAVANSSGSASAAPAGAPAG